jgi:hypothetical protein
LDSSANFRRFDQAKYYKPKGAYPEAYSYWGYETSFYVMFFDAIQRVFKTDFGLPTTEGFLKTA